MPHVIVINICLCSNVRIFVDIVIKSKLIFYGIFRSDLVRFRNKLITLGSEEVIRHYP